MITFEQTPSNSPEQQKADRARFMRAVQSAMTLANRHPDGSDVKDQQGRPVAKTLVDDVNLPQGSARVWIKIGPSEDPRHAGQPQTTITVANKFDSFSKIHETEVKHYPVTRLNYFGDGTIGVYYAHEVEDIDKEEEYYLNGNKSPEDKPLDVTYFEIKLEKMVHDKEAPDDPAFAYLGTYDDWDHVESVEEAIEALALQNGL